MHVNINSPNMVILMAFRINQSATVLCSYMQVHVDVVMVNSSGLLSDIGVF